MYLFPPFFLTANPDGSSFTGDAATIFGHEAGPKKK